MNRIGKWIGRISTFMLLQIAFLVFWFVYQGQVPERELSLLWTAIKTGESALDAEKKEEPEGVEDQSVTPRFSFDERKRLAALRSKEIEQQAKQAEALNRLATARQMKIEQERAALEKLQAEIKAGIEEKQEEVVKQGQAKVKTLLEASKPQVAKAFLLSLTDDKVAASIVKRLDEIAAARVFKEFTGPEVDELNRWLSMIEEGEPDRSVLKEMQDRAEKQP